MSGEAQLPGMATMIHNTSQFNSDMKEAESGAVSGSGGSSSSSGKLSSFQQLAEELSGSNAGKVTQRSAVRSAIGAGRVPTRTVLDQAWSIVEDYDLLFALCFARGELEYLCGHHQRSFLHFQFCLQRTQQLTQQVAIYRQLIRLKTIAGEYQFALILAVKGLMLLGVEVQGLVSSLGHQRAEWWRTEHSL